jgi:hypothetical protein
MSTFSVADAKLNSRNLFAGSRTGGSIDHQTRAGGRDPDGVPDNASWKCPGHGSIVTTPGGQTFLLHHAYPRKPKKEDHRDVVLDEVGWKSDGWPVINDYRGVSAEGSVTTPRTAGVARRNH